jgi:acetylornithine deacetylase/succinyl-diaminopimelate desuccinylase-like protein
LSAAEKLFGWNTLEVLSFLTGNPAQPMNAIPGQATAVCQLRFVVGTDWEHLEQAVRAHLDAHGFSMVTSVRCAAPLRRALTRPIRW